MGGGLSIQSNDTKETISQFYRDISQVVVSVTAEANIETRAINSLTLEYCSPAKCYAAGQTVPANFAGLCSGLALGLPAAPGGTINQQGLSSSNLSVQALSEISQRVKAKLEVESRQIVRNAIENDPGFLKAISNLSFNTTDVVEEISREVVNSISNNAQANCSGLTLTSNDATVTICAPVRDLSVTQNAAAFSATSCIAKQITEQLSNNETLTRIIQEAENVSKAGSSISWTTIIIIVVVVIVIIIIVGAVLGTRGGDDKKPPPRRPLPPPPPGVAGRIPPGVAGRIPPGVAGRIPPGVAGRIPPAVRIAAGY